MQANDKPVRKPMLSSQGNKNVEPYDRKLTKVEIFYRYVRNNTGTTLRPFTANSKYQSTRN